MYSFLFTSNKNLHKEILYKDILHCYGNIKIYLQIQAIEPKLGRKALKKVKKTEREKTKGSDWFHMKAPEMTPELQNELDVLKMRSAIDPTRFYKRADAATQPKYFQVFHSFVLFKMLEKKCKMFECFSFQKSIGRLNGKETN